MGESTAEEPEAWWRTLSHSIASHSDNQYVHAAQESCRHSRQTLWVSPHDWQRVVRLDFIHPLCCSQETLCKQVTQSSWAKAFHFLGLLRCIAWNLKGPHTTCQTLPPFNCVHLSLMVLRDPSVRFCSQSPMRWQSFPNHSAKQDYRWQNVWTAT